MGGRYNITNRGKDEEKEIAYLSVMELGRNETYIYHLNSEAGAEEKFNFLELFSP